MQDNLPSQSLVSLACRSVAGANFKFTFGPLTGQALFSAPTKPRSRSLSALAPLVLPGLQIPIQHPVIHYSCIRFQCINTFHSPSIDYFSLNSYCYSLFAIAETLSLIIQFQFQFLFDLELPHLISRAESPYFHFRSRAHCYSPVAGVAEKTTADMPCGLGGSKTTQRKLVLLYVDLWFQLYLRMFCAYSAGRQDTYRSNKADKEKQRRWCMW